MPFAGVEWLFFDIGSTLVDESRAYARRIRETVAGSAVPCDQFYQSMLDFERGGRPGYAAAVEAYHLARTPWPVEEECLYPDAERSLRKLSHCFHLGIIANQVAGAAARLESMGIAPYFELVLASVEEGVAKPDPEIFRRALRRAGCAPERAVMIGDRLDNDIAPAKSLGMRTIRVQQGPSAQAKPQNDGETPDAAASCLTELLAILIE